jgi:hypothetical protein
MSRKEGQIKKLINQLKIDNDVNEITEYKVIENFVKKQTYLVHNLEAEVEAGEVFFGDIEGVIASNQFVLMGFLNRSVIDLSFELDKVVINFASGSIQIQKIS